MLHNTTDSTEYYKVSPVQNRLVFFQAKHPPHFLAWHCSFPWENIWENWTCIFRKWKDCKGFLCFAKRKQIAVQLSSSCRIAISSWLKTYWAATVKIWTRLLHTSGDIPTAISKPCMAIETCNGQDGLATTCN